MQIWMVCRIARVIEEKKPWLRRPNLNQRA
jgi:hypothetical protein